MRTRILGMLLLTAMPALTSSWAIDVRFHDSSGALLTDCTIVFEETGPGISRRVLPPNGTGTYTVDLEPGQKVVFRAYDEQNEWTPASRRVPLDLQGPLDVTLHRAQAQHTCSEALAIAVPSTTPFDTTGAGADPMIDGVTCGSANLDLGDGLWYEVLGTGNTMTASTCDNADFDTQIAVFCLTCQSPICVAGNDDFGTCADFSSEVSWESSFGANYYIYVTGFSSFDGVASGTGVLTVSDDGLPAFADVSCFNGEFTPVGACCTCLNAPGNCMITTQAECDSLNGNLPGQTLGYLGNDVPCVSLGINAFDYVVNPGTPISDGTGANQASGFATLATIDVADDFIVGDVDVDFQTAHTWASDLQVSLQSPGGTQVILSSRWCNGNAAGPFPGMDVVYDSDSLVAGPDLCIAATGIIGTANTEDTQGGFGNSTGSLDEFDGEGASGTWTLIVEDLFTGDTGAIDQFSLHFTDSVSNCPVITGGGTGGDGDTTLCHCPPGNSNNCHTITVGAPAVDSHLNNHPNDSLGACVDDEDSSGSSGHATAEGLDFEGSHDGLLGLGFSGTPQQNTTSDVKSRVDRSSGRSR